MGYQVLLGYLGYLSLYYPVRIPRYSRIIRNPRIPRYYYV